MSWLSSIVAPVLGTGVGALLGGPVGAMIGGSLGAGISSAKSVEDTNKANIDLTRETNATQIELANTAHQREVADLKAAGLNPILSSKYGGSATPGLSAPSVASMAPVLQNTAQGVQQAYLSTQNLAADLQVKKTQALANSAQAVSTGEEARRRAMENDVLEFEASNRRFEEEYRKSRPAHVKKFGIDVSDSVRSLLPIKGLFK